MTTETVKYLTQEELLADFENLLDWVNEVTGRIYIKATGADDYETVLISAREAVILGITNPEDINGTDPDAS